MQFCDRNFCLETGRFATEACPFLGLGVGDWRDLGQYARSVATVGRSTGLANAATEAKLADGVVFVAIQPIQVCAEHRQQESEWDRKERPQQRARESLEKLQHIDEFPAHKPEVAA